MLNSLRVCLRGDTKFIYDDKINISPVYAKNCLLINNLYEAEEKIIKKITISRKCKGTNRIFRYLFSLKCINLWTSPYFNFRIRNIANKHVNDSICPCLWLAYTCSNTNSLIEPKVFKVAKKINK